MEKELAKRIINNIQNDQSVVLIGGSDSGKTRFLKEFLCPELKKRGIEFRYVEESLEAVIDPSTAGIIIADEFETFVDKDYLENEHPDENPYYTDSYIVEVNKMHKEFSKHGSPVIFVVTRNSDNDINYLLNNIKDMETGHPVKAYKISR